ncbi:hypothetical protein FRB98_006358 [Tulasnella sp. 332]|nr:hypothetical protein FRB98_006358 [Tulasnella sp. 332]
MSAIERMCGEGYEFVYPDGLHVLSAADLESFHVKWHLPETATVASPRLESPAKAFWVWGFKQWDSYHGLRETIVSLRDLCKREKFDGVIGFSQGAALGSLICAMLERPHVYPEFLIDGEPPQPPMRFGVFMSGIQLGASSVAAVYDGHKIQTPCLLLAAANDIVAHPRQFNIFPMLFEHSKAVLHDRGHNIPSGPKWQKLIADYIRDSCPPIRLESTTYRRSRVDDSTMWQARL